MLALIGDVIGQRGQALERIQTQGAVGTRGLGDGVVGSGNGPGRMEDHPARLLVIDAPQSHRRPEKVNGQLLPGPGIVRLDSRTLEGGKSGMPKTVQDFDRRRGNLLQL